MAESQIKVEGCDIFAGAKAVTSAGTAERLRATTAVPKGFKSVLIRAKVANTGKIYVGGSDVASSTNGGLDPGDSIIFSSKRLMLGAEFYVDSAENGEGVDYWLSR